MSNISRDKNVNLSSLSGCVIQNCPEFIISIRKIMVVPILCFSVKLSPILSYGLET